MDVRVIELPATRMATTGPGPEPGPPGDGRVLPRFDLWRSARADVLPPAPCDLLWLDPRDGAPTWGYVLGPDDDGGPWDVVEVPGGLYAGAVCREADDADGERVLGLIRAWVGGSPLLLDEGPRRPVAFRIPSPERVAGRAGHHRLEVLVPVRRAGDAVG